MSIMSLVGATLSGGKRGSKTSTTEGSDAAPEGRKSRAVTGGADRSSRRSRACTSMTRRTKAKSIAFARVEHAQPLVKFTEAEEGEEINMPEEEVGKEEAESDSDEDMPEKPYLEDAGLNLLKRTPGYFCPIVLMGDGRAGKSLLASRLLKLDGCFESSDSCEAVTEGIDVLVWPLSLLVEQGAVIDPSIKDVDQINLLVLDCEGGNNAMADVHEIVNVLGAIVGTSIIYVGAQMLSEASVENLAATLSCRSLIELDDVNLGEQKLSFVVNKTTLNYDKGAFDKMLSTEQTDDTRRQNRKVISESYPERDFFCVPMSGMPNFDEKVDDFCASVLKNCKPLEMGGCRVQSKQLVGLLECIISQNSKRPKFSLPSMQRVVVFDGFLKPTIEEYVKTFKSRLPKLTEYDLELDEKDPRKALYAEFGEAISHIKAEKMVKEATKLLHDRVDALWDEVLQTNEVYEQSWHPPMGALDIETLRANGGQGGNCADRCANGCIVQ